MLCDVTCLLHFHTKPDELFFFFVEKSKQSISKLTFGLVKAECVCVLGAIHVKSLSAVLSQQLIVSLMPQNHIDYENEMKKKNHRKQRDTDKLEWKKRTTNGNLMKKENIAVFCDILFYLRSHRHIVQFWLNQVMMSVVLAHTHTHTFVVFSLRDLIVTH